MRIVVVGSGGRLGRALTGLYGNEFAVTELDRARLDLADVDAVRATIGELQFELAINCAALTNVDYCETHREEAFQINARAPEALAVLCRAKGARLIHLSTDYVFDGQTRVPYVEDDEPRPISVYGESKLAGEQAVLSVSETSLVVRVSWVFGPDRPSFIDQVISRARENPEVAAIADKISAPTYTLDVAQWLRLAWEAGLGGVVHLSNAGECSWQQYGQHALDCCRAAGIELRATTVAPLTLGDMKNFIARRPVYTVLSGAKFARLTGVCPRSWRDAVAEYVSNYIYSR